MWHIFVQSINWTWKKNKITTKQTKRKIRHRLLGKISHNYFCFSPLLSSSVSLSFYLQWCKSDKEQVEGVEVNIKIFSTDNVSCTVHVFILYFNLLLSVNWVENPQVIICYCVCVCMCVRGYRFRIYLER